MKQSISRTLFTEKKNKSAKVFQGHFLPRKTVSLPKYFKDRFGREKRTSLPKYFKVNVGRKNIPKVCNRLLNESFGLNSFGP